VPDLLLDALKIEGLVGAGGKQRTDSTHVIGAVRDLNRLELAGESVRACLEAIAVAAPDWLPTVIDISGWGRRYGARVDTWRLPTSKTKRAELMVAYGTDAVALLRAVHDAGDAAAPPWLCVHASGRRRHHGASSRTRRARSAWRSPRARDRRPAPPGRPPSARRHAGRTRRAPRGGGPGRVGPRWCANSARSAWPPGHRDGRQRVGASLRVSPGRGPRASA
jgi:hypothetical protein